MNISVLYGILIMLISNRRVRRDELAAHFEVSPRTVQRYVDELIAGGVPIDAIAGKHGGYFISDSYKMPYLLFTPDELGRLKMCLTAFGGTFKDGVTERVYDKLTALENGAPVCQSPPLVIDSDAWNGCAGSLQSRLDAVQTAISDNRALMVNYTDKNGRSSRRKIDPYTLALKEGVWYVYGRCHIHNDFRLFRLARMKGIEFTEEIFARRPDADVRSALSVSLGDRINIELEFDESALAGIEEWLGAESVRRSNKLVCRAIVGDGDDLVRKILSFGTRVRVSAPRRLAERVNEVAEEIAAQNRKNFI